MAIQQGAKSEELTSRTNIAAKDLKKPDNRISLDQYIELWQVALELTGNKALGLELGADLNYKRMGIVGNIAKYSKTVRDSAAILIRFSRLMNESEVITLEESSEWATIRYQIVDPRYYMIQCIERSMASLVTFYRFHSEKILTIKEIRFQHKQPDYGSLYCKIFKAQILFSQPDNAVVLNRSFLDAENPEAQDYLQEILTQHAENMLKQLGNSDKKKDQVKLIIMEELHKGEISIENVSAKLNISRQTLYRNLKKEGTSFHELHEEIRKNLAEVYLKQSQIFSITEITFLLGFSDPSAFHHAFKRWFGISPSEYAKMAATS